MLGIIDFGSGNLFAFQSIYKLLGVPHMFIRSREHFDLCSHIVLPGVGDYDETLKLLDENGFLDILNIYVLPEKKFFLGVCVGMQILGSRSEEGSRPGLNWIPGSVSKIPSEGEEGLVRLPHMGWNSLNVIRQSKLIDGIDLEKGAYFLHNYEFITDDPECVISTADYSKKITSIVNKGNVYGVQFHPEKSHSNGIRLLENFSKL